MDQRAGTMTGPKASRLEKQAWKTPVLVKHEIKTITNGSSAGTGENATRRPNSDRRLKENIVQVGMLPSRLPVYRFRYIATGVEYVGVMAQDVIDIFPEAVFADDAGFYSVDYAALGIKMVTREEFERNPVSMLETVCLKAA